MGLGAKLLAGVVLLGTLWGFTSTAMTFFYMSTSGALEGILESGGLRFILPIVFGVVFNICALVLAILVLASSEYRAPRAAP